VSALTALASKVVRANLCGADLATDLKAVNMQAQVGDKIVVKGHRVGDPQQSAEILEVEGNNGEPPYRVRSESNGREGMFFPGSDAAVEHRPDR
jgi:hypothetical protein